MEPGSLAWRRMQARKFIWFDGDVTIRKLPKEGGETRSGDQDRPRGNGHPDPERG